MNVIKWIKWNEYYYLSRIKRIVSFEYVKWTLFIEYNKINWKNKSNVIDCIV